MMGLLAVLALSGCETVKGWTGSDSRSNASESPVSITPQSASGTASTRLDSAPGIRTVPALGQTSGMTSMSGGSVEVYDVNGAAPSSAFGGMQSGMGMSAADQSIGVPAVTRDYNGVTLASDPSVTVFPLDGDMTGATGSIYGAQDTSPQWPAPVSQYPASPTAAPLAPKSGAGVSSLYFPYGSAQLDGKDRSALDGIAETAKFAPVDRVRIEGHASPDTQTSDPVEARILNLRESLKRAGNVSEKLIQKGVPAEKIETVGWGDTVPASGREQQRRVDIITGGN